MVADWAEGFHLGEFGPPTAARCDGSVPTVPRSDLCSGVDEFVRHFWAIRGSGKVQSCIARVDVVADLYKEVRAGARSLTGCSILERRGRQRWALAHHSGESYSIVVDDSVYQPS